MALYVPSHVLPAVSVAVGCFFCENAAREGQTVTTSRLLDAKAASELLAVPPSWLLAQARAGTVPHVRLGKYVRFVEADIEEWIESVKRGPKSDGIG